ncbi:hypothetical protein Tco_0000952 [Tanacetum coccineum]
MSADSAVTYTSVHSEARSWSIPSEDPYEEAARQLLEQAPHSPDEGLRLPTPLLPPSFLSPRIRPLSPRALEVEMRDVASALYHSLHPSGTPPLLPIPLPAPSTSRRADIPEADTPPRKRLLLTTPRPECEVGESSAAAAAARQPGPTMAHRVDCSFEGQLPVDVRCREDSEFPLRTSRWSQEGSLQLLRAKFEALEARVTVLETEMRRHEWQRQVADDLAVQHIMRTQALEAGARVGPIGGPLVAVPGLWL